VALRTRQTGSGIGQLRAELAYWLVGGMDGDIGLRGFTRLHGRVLEAVLSEFIEAQRNVRRAQTEIDLRGAEGAFGHAGE
jgi:hypothetical protein